jgi:hypothetical protein
MTSYAENKAALSAMSQSEYAAHKVVVLKDALDLQRGKKAVSDFPRTFSEEERRALIDADIAAIEAGGPKIGVPATAEPVSTSSTAYKPAPKTDSTPTNAREMTGAQYSVARAAFIRG